MAFQHHKFKAWITRRLLTPPLADRFELHHRDAVGGSSMICRLDVAPQASSDVLGGALARQVSEESSEHINGLEGRQQYIVRAFVGEKPIAEFAFHDYCASLSHAATSLAEPIPEVMGTATPPASIERAIAAMVNQQLRHTEAMTRLVVDLTSRNGERDIKLIASQQTHIDRLEGRCYETNELLESLLSKQAQREFERQKFETEQAHKEALFKKIMDQIVPGLAHAWKIPLPSGIKVPVADEDSNTETIKRLFSDLPKPMQDEIMSTLGEEKGLELMQAFGFVVPESEARH